MFPGCSVKVTPIKLIAAYPIGGYIFLQPHYLKIINPIRNKQPGDGTKSKTTKD